MIPLSSSCVKLVYVLVLSRATRSLFWTLRSERCVRKPIVMEIALYCRSKARSGATRKSGGAERSGELSGRCRKTMERSEVWSGGLRRGDGLGSGGYKIRLERGTAF